MNKSKALRVGGFVVAVAASAALIGAATGATGAYFTASADGNLTGSSGSLTISATNTSLNFSNLNPGVDKSQTVNFAVNSGSSTNADIWLVFDSTSAAYGAFTGSKTSDTSAYNGWTSGGMGQYGHFKVVSAVGYKFESYNLQLPSVSAATGGYTSTGTNTCKVTTNGLGGSSAQHVVGGGNDIAECGVPAAILLQRNLAPGIWSSATITFGLTGKQTQQFQGNDPNVPFKIVATQPGILPYGPTW